MKRGALTHSATAPPYTVDSTIHIHLFPKSLIPVFTQLWTNVLHELCWDGASPMAMLKCDVLHAMRIGAYMAVPTYVRICCSVWGESPVVL